MDMQTVIILPGDISPTRDRWTGTLAEAIRLDGDRMTQDAESRGIPVDDEGDVDWDRVTIEHIQTMCDDPNAVVAAGTVDAGSVPELAKETGLHAADFAVASGDFTGFSQAELATVHAVADGMVRAVEVCVKEGDAKVLTTHVDESTMPEQADPFVPECEARLHRQAAASAFCQLREAGVRDVLVVLRHDPEPVHPTWENRAHLEQVWGDILGQAIEAAGSDAYSHPDDEGECSVAMGSWMAELLKHDEVVHRPFGNPQGADVGTRIRPGTDVTAVFEAWDDRWNA